MPISGLGDLSKAFMAAAKDGVNSMVNTATKAAGEATRETESTLGTDTAAFSSLESSMQRTGVGNFFSVKMTGEPEANDPRQMALASFTYLDKQNYFEGNPVVAFFHGHQPDEIEHVQLFHTGNGQYIGEIGLTGRQPASAEVAFQSGSKWDSNEGANYPVNIQH